MTDRMAVMGDEIQFKTHPSRAFERNHTVTRMFARLLVLSDPS